MQTRMNSTIMLNWLIVISIAVIGITAKEDTEEVSKCKDITEFKDVKDDDSNHTQICTIEYDLQGVANKTITREAYDLLHQDILKALNGGSCTTEPANIGSTKTSNVAELATTTATSKTAELATTTATSKTAETTQAPTTLKLITSQLTTVTESTTTTTEPTKAIEPATTTIEAITTVQVVSTATTIETVTTIEPAMTTEPATTIETATTIEPATTTKITSKPATLTTIEPTMTDESITTAQSITSQLTTDPNRPVDIPSNRKRRSAAGDTPYGNETLFFIDLKENKVKENILRVPVVLQRTNPTIPDDCLYKCLMQMNQSIPARIKRSVITELNNAIGLKVVSITKGLPGDIFALSQPSHAGSGFWLPIVIAISILLVVLLLSTVFCFVFSSKRRSKVQQENHIDELGQRKEIITDKAPTLMSYSPNGRHHPTKTQNGGHPAGITLDDTCDWLVPMAEFENKKLLTSEYV